MDKTENNKTADNALQRSHIYNFLATIYHQEMSTDLLRQIKEPQFLEALAGMGVKLEDEILNEDEDQVIQNLAVEYTRLFLGPGKHVSPFESVHHERADGDWGKLWGADTAAVKRFIETTGLEYQSGYEGLPDHIAVELEFMHKLTERETRAWNEGDNEGAIYCLKVEKKFIEEHLDRWVPLFCEKVTAEAELPFYREIAEITKAFLELEREEIEKYLPPT